MEVNEVNGVNGVGGVPGGPGVGRGWGWAGNWDRVEQKIHFEVLFRNVATTHQKTRNTRDSPKFLQLTFLSIHSHRSHVDTALLPEHL